MTNVLFQGTGGMEAVASAATANFGVESYMQSQLNLIGQVGNNPSPQQMMQLAQAYQFFSAMWSGTSFTSNGVNVDFKTIKDQNVVADLPALHEKLKTLFTSYNNVTIPSPGGDGWQLFDENNQPLTLLDLVTGRPDDPKFMIHTNTIETDGDQSSVDWYDGCNADGNHDMDDTTYHNDHHMESTHHFFMTGSGDYSSSLDPNFMPPGFDCEFTTYSSGCHVYNHTHFTLTIDPSAKTDNPTDGQKACGVTAGQTAMQWLQQHASVQPDNNPAKEDPSMTQSQYDLNQFDTAFNKLMND